MLLKIAATLIVFLIAGFLLTPRSERVQTHLNLADPRDPRRSIPDPGHSWHAEAKGRIVRTNDQTGRVVGRFTDATNREADLAVRWSSNTRTGLLLAPHVAGQRLFFIHYGSNQAGEMTAYLRRVDGAAPEI